VPKHEVFEERFGEGEEPAAADSQGAEATVINQRVKGKKQQHQRQRTEVKKARKEHEVEHKQVALNAVKDSVVQGGEAEGGRMRRCKQPVAQTTLAWRAHQQCPQQQQQQLESKPLSQLPQPLARRRQRRLPRTFSVPKEELEGGLRSLTRYFLSIQECLSTWCLLHVSESFCLLYPTSDCNEVFPGFFCLIILVTLVKVQCCGCGAAFHLKPCSDCSCGRGHCHCMLLTHNADLLAQLREFSSSNPVS
jgi:hypothetical protein